MNTQQTFATHLSTLSSTRRDGLTTIFRKAQGRGLPETSGWLNPEESIGPYLDRNRWTRFKFWEAIGPARDVYNDIAPRIRHCLQGSVEPIPNRVTWSMYMVGRAPSQASPSIIFCCEVLWYRRHIRDIIKESGILDDYPPGIKTGHLPRPPGFDQLVPLGVADQPLGEMMMLTPHTRSACGSQIFSNARLRGTNSISLSAVATIGGVIRLGRAYYYTTAAHAILPSPDSTAGDEEWPADDGYTSALSLDGMEETRITPAPNPSTDNLSISNSHGGASEQSDVNKYLRDDIVRQWSLKRHHEAEEPLYPLADPGTLSLDRTEMPFMTSMDVGSQATDLDYALVEMTSRHHNLENVVTFGPKHETVVKVHSFVRSVPQDADIIAVTSRGTIKGRISGTPVYASAPGQRVYRRMYKVSVGSPLQRGDCGTWIVDATSGHLFGHVVLGSPAGDTALLIPFADVSDDILARTGKSPIFPGARGDGTTRSDEALVRIIRKTIDSMSEELASPRDDVVDKALQVGAGRIEEPFDLPRSKEDLKGLGNQPIREKRSGRKKLISSKTDDALITSRPAGQRQIPLRAESDPIHRTGDVSDDSARPVEQEELQQMEKSREPFKPTAKADSNLLRDAARKKSLAMLERGTQHQGHVSIRDKSMGSPMTLKHPKIRDVLLTFSKAPLRWENTELLDHALKEIDLDTIFSDAEQEHKQYMSRTENDGEKKPEWGYQDCVIRALSSYFRRSFFTRIRKPPCEACPAKLPTIPRGNVRPNPEEKAGKAHVVELFQCAEKHCGAYTRFPRYWDPGTLLRNPRGRAGEGTNCFGLLCRALGSRVRWVWNAEDRIWIEVYSEHRGRWVHVDACEGSWDDPLLYTETKGKKLSHCIAFSVDGATDVTRRYVRSSDHEAPRTQCSEAELVSILHDIRSKRRRDVSKDDLARLEKEDAAEAQELESYTDSSNTVRTPDSSQPASIKLGSTTMLGRGGKEKSEESPLTSATSYPGQEWNPYGDAWIDDS